MKSSSKRQSNGRAERGRVPSGRPRGGGDGKGVPMSRASFMPRREIDQVMWAKTFLKVVRPDAEAYGLTQDMLDRFAELNDTLQSVWQDATNPSLCTRGLLATKREALAAMRAAATGLVTIIQGTAGVSDQMKLDAQLTVRKARPSTRPVPEAAPQLLVTGMVGRSVELRLRHNETGRGRPSHAAMAIVLTASGPVAPLDGSAWSFAAVTTQPRLTLDFGPSTVGDSVWVLAFWVNAKGQCGPQSRPLQVHLPAGSSLTKTYQTVQRLEAA